MEKALVTIVLPLYNNEEYVSYTLDSVWKQSFGIWNCIVVDDGSTDESVDLVKKFVQRDHRFALLQRTNYTITKGANACRNIGLNNAVTDYVMFVDADDYLHRDCLANRWNTIMERGGMDVYVFKTAFANIQGQVTGYFHNPNQDLQDIIYRLVSHKIPWHTMSPVWSVDFMKAIGGWNEEYERLQDVELNIRALLSDPKMMFADMAVDSYYRVNGMSQGKKIAARMGFTRLAKDYYGLLMDTDKLTEVYKVKIRDKIQDILEGQFLTYVKYADKRDKRWEDLYLDTLSALHIDMDEQTSVKYIFSKC